jgi:ABC-type multidrug transport system fused ATPase/permease subunit
MLSISLFTRLLDQVLKAPMSFFDTTPVGRIINRFSKDVYSLDEDLPGSFQSFVCKFVCSFYVGLALCLCWLLPI